MPASYDDQTLFVFYAHGAGIPERSDAQPGYSCFSLFPLQSPRPFRTTLARIFVFCFLVFFVQNLQIGTSIFSQVSLIATLYSEGARSRTERNKE